jgi:hypothetical protein
MFPHPNSVMHEHRDQNNDRQWNSNKPKQSTFSEPHYPLLTSVMLLNQFPGIKKVPFVEYRWGGTVVGNTLTPFEAPSVLKLSKPTSRAATVLAITDPRAERRRLSATNRASIS